MFVTQQLGRRQFYRFHDTVLSTQPSRIVITADSNISLPADPVLCIGLQCILYTVELLRNTRRTSKKKKLSILYETRRFINIHSNSFLFPGLCQLYPIHSLLTYVFKINFDHVFQSSIGSPNWCFPFSCPDLYFICVLCTIPICCPQ